MDLYKPSAPSEQMLRVFLYVNFPEKCPVVPLLRSIKGAEVTLSYNILQLDSTKHNLVIVPGGTARKQQTDMGADGVAHIKKFIADGGGYVGFCAGGFLVGWNEDKKVGLKLLPVNFMEPLKGNILGNVTLKTDEGTTFPCQYHNGPLYAVDEFTLQGREDELKKQDPNFNTELDILAHIEEGVSGYHKQMQGTVAIFRGFYGKGHVVGIGPHPEKSKELWPYLTALLLSCVKQ